RRLAADVVVRMLDVPVVQVAGGRVEAEHGIGLVAADRPHQLAPEVERVLQAAVFVSEELHRVDAEARRGAALLDLARYHQDARVYLGMLTALVAARADDVAHPRTPLAPERDRAA